MRVDLRRKSNPSESISTEDKRRFIVDRLWRRWFEWFRSTISKEFGHLFEWIETRRIGVIDEFIGVFLNGLNMIINLLSSVDLPIWLAERLTDWNMHRLFRRGIWFGDVHRWNMKWSFAENRRCLYILLLQNKLQLTCRGVKVNFQTRSEKIDCYCLSLRLSLSSIVIVGIDFDDVDEFSC